MDTQNSGKAPGSYPTARYTVIHGDDILYLTDDGGEDSRSVTNDAELIVAELWRLYRPGRIVYCDSRGEWDEILHEGPRFKGFAPWAGPVPGAPFVARLAMNRAQAHEFLGLPPPVDNDVPANRYEWLGDPPEQEVNP
jgi:hypothetical protein